MRKGSVARECIRLYRLAVTNNSAISDPVRHSRQLRGLAAPLLLLGAACAQPLKLTPSDASRVLSQRTITAPNPGVPGTFSFKKLYYGSGGDRNRPEYRDSLTYKTATVDASPFVRMEPAVAKTRKKYWGFDPTRFPRNARLWYPEGAGPFPVVLVVHGNHNPKEFSDPGYQWLGELLASVEDGFHLAACNHQVTDENCSLTHICPIKGPMAIVHQRIMDVLNQVTLSELFPVIQVTPAGGIVLPLLSVMS